MTRDSTFPAIPASRRRVLVLHSDPPVPCLYTFELGLRKLGHDVVTVGPKSGFLSSEAWQGLLGPRTFFVAAPDEHIDDIFARIGGPPDWVFYLRPHEAFLPRGLATCPVPTVAWFEDEFKYADAYHHLSYYFDLVGTAYEEIQEGFAERGHDNWVCFNYFTASWLEPEDDIAFGGRSIDVSFVGHSDPRTTRLRRLELEKLSRLAAEGINVEIREGPYLRDMMRVYAQSKIVYQHSGQGPPNLTYRVGEAMTAGAMVLAKRPNRVGGLVEPLIDGEHIVYYDEFSEAADLIRHYLEDDDARLKIAEAGHKYVREDVPWLSQVHSFLEQHVYTIGGDFRERRAERLRRFGVDARTERIDRAWFFGVSGAPMEQVRNEIEAIDGWREDVEARALRAAAGSPEYDADVEFALSGEPSHLLGYSNHAVRLFMMRQTVGANAAIEALQAAVDRLAHAPPDALPSSVEGLTALSDMRLREEITRAYVDLSPDDRRVRLLAVLLAQLYRCIGILLFEAGRWSQAFDWLSRALGIVTDDGYAYAYLARCKKQLGEDQEAVRLFRRAVALEPDFVEATSELAELLLKSGAHAKAAHLLEQARWSYTTADAARMGILIGLGAAHIRGGAAGKARAVLTQALEELDTGAIDMGSWKITRASDAIPEDQGERTRSAIQTLLDQVGE